MNRIRDILRTRDDRKLLVPFLTVGYPSLRTCIELTRTAIDSGADMVELGMPFSDPMADGPQIQYSSQVALDNGTSLNEVLTAVEQVRAKSDVPIVLMGYYNPVLAHGTSRFASRANAAGADGFIIPDLPIEEAGSFRGSLDKQDMSAIFLAAPTSTPKRVKQINSASTDFVYAVTIAGVTGSSRSFDTKTDNYLKQLSASLTKPFVAGFGVSSPESAQRLCRYADGVVIGSALIRTYREARNKKAGRQAIGRLLKSIRRAID